ncbi:MAG: hypothetical protein A2V70_19055 [Planctomycetes bacterium RBG_13_63_9]|nr:MAG: hypothetical protein A2V70_19055 [Planctomycetes bacterium RBG_13_63_9]
MCKTTYPRWMVCLAGGLVGLACTVGAVFADGGARALRQEDPITIAASTVGDFSRGYSWYVSINSAGEGQLTVRTPGRAVRQSFAVSEEQLDVLRDAVANERFFDLDSEYGQTVPDGSTKTLTIIVGNRSKTVLVRYLMNWAQPGHQKQLSEPARALRVWMVLRGWFSHEQAVDLRRYDQKVLNAAGKGS